MTTRASRDLDASPTFRPEAPLPANVRRFPIVIDPWTIFLMAERQRRRVTEKAIARNTRRAEKRGNE
jgi:hypothetical protein